MVAYVDLSESSGGGSTGDPWLLDGRGSLGLEEWRVLDASLGAGGTAGAHPHFEEGLYHSLAQGYG